MRNGHTRLKFVILTQQPWEDKNIGSNIWDMAYTLAKTHQVLLVNQAMDWSVRFGEGSKKFQQRQRFIQRNNGQHLIEVEADFWVLSPKVTLGSFNWLPDSPVYDGLNRCNGRRLAVEIKSVLSELQWESYILINDNDMLRGFYLKELLRPELYVYYLRDNLSASTYWKRHGARLEPKLIVKADLIVSNSIYLTKQAARYNSNAVYIGQGCDQTLFDPDKVEAEPSDIARLPKPRIGYTGALTAMRLNVELIEAVATRRPDWQVVLIGPTDESFPKERLLTLPNVTILGARPMRQIPAYLASMDVLINPQVLNEMTIGNYPRKVDEYLAMGKPVVAVRTEAMALFEKHVFLAETTDAFIDSIAKALDGTHPSTAKERIAFALSHTWENSVRLLSETIDKLLTKKVRAA
ncbi:MAG: glycosyltransferase [Cytophagaceae bacterium]|nr:glycosyltransferase [Cytophagaceae bacterium]